MSLLERHRYMISRLAEAFGFVDENEIERMILQPDAYGAVNAFFSAEGPNKILIAIEKLENSGAMILGENGEAELTHRLRVFSDEIDYIPSTTVYFMKNRKGKENTVDYAIDPTKVNDGAISFGVLRAPLESLEAMMRCVYRPIIQSMTAESWGKASEEHKAELLASMEVFTKGLQDSIRSISGGLELRRPDERIESLGSAAASDPSLVAQALNLLQEWCMKIEKYLDDSDRSRWETPDSGPDTELSYWRNRTQRLTSITEQLKGKAVKSVISVLTSASRFSENDSYIDFQRVTSLLTQWREIDVQITEAANEAKDNVKYLTTIERFFDPLYGNDPAQIIDTLPALINGIKMIHTIARYYGTTDRVTKLFMKITNQMIATCKLSINGKDIPDKIWEKDLPTLLETIEKCLQLNEQYQEQYRITKEKLMLNPKGRQFDFSETQIFGKFDLFCRRLIKLMDMFSTVQQFRSLEEHRFEGLDPLIETFKEVVQIFRSKGHDLLDYQQSKFDRDYVDFNIRMNELELTLQQFINRSFENINSIEQSLNLLRNYQSILHRENLRADLDSKLSVIFNNYGQELIEIEQIYEKSKHNPPIARNMPPVAGNITWARHLLRKIEDPMVKFQGNAAILSTKESKKIIRTYNKVAKTLIAFEYLWYEAWCASIEAAKAGLQATLIIRHEKTGQLYVNFDPEIFQLLREAKCLVKLDIAIPESAKLILLQEESFKAYYNDLKFMLAEYERITNRIIPVTTKVLSPFLKTLELKLRPGLVSLTWTSLNIDQYKNSIYSGLKRLEEMVMKINDIVENRVQKNLKQLSRTILVSLPNERAVTLDEFVQMQELSVKSNTHQLSMRNLEIEHAVEDLISIIQSSQIDSSISPVTQEDTEEVHNHFSHMTYQAFLNGVKTSLNLLKKKTCYRVGQIKLEPFFEVDVQLSVPSVRLSPTLDEIQSAINLSAVAVFGCMNKMYQWRQNHIPEKDRQTYFDWMGKDIEIIKTVLLLTGAMHGTRNMVQEYLRSFRKYDWLWKDDKELAYKHFVKSNPSIHDFENELIKFLTLEKEISSIASIRVIGALRLNTSNIKHQLTAETRVWKVLYSNKVHKLAKDAMAKLYEYLRVLTNKLNIEVQSLDTLRYVMMVLKEVREKESSIEMDISPILDMYIMLDHYLPGGVVNQEELEQKANMLVAWRKVVEHADSVAQGLSALQGTYKKQLVWDIREFGLDIRAFRTDFESNGPMQPGIKSAIALEKLRKYKDELASRERKMEMYKAGEELFALRPTRFAELGKTRKDVNLIDQLYSIYADVYASVKQWSGLLWGNVSEQIGNIAEVINGYEARCKKLPKKLREWAAYDEVCSKIADLQALLPLLAGLSKASIKPRHWIEINTLLAPTKTTLPYQDEEFAMAHIFNSAIVQFKEEVEEICDGADKQLQIEKRLLELKERWAIASFEFSIWKNRDVPVLKAFGFVIEELEEAQLQLQSLLSIRHVAPFKDDVHKFLTSLSDTADTLEMWVKVQMLWTSLESVFLGGDIAKQMPLEAKKFTKINKDWEKLMVRAAEVKMVVASCSNELLRTTLPVLYSELEKCQKSLEGYLEQKRSKFPRFYFVSNPVLLLILSQGSDAQQMQPYYEKVFDSIDRVVHSKFDKLQIVEILSIIGNAKETVALSKSVKAMGNIEDWLGEIEKEMQRSLKKLCETVAYECINTPLRQFVNRSCGQCALLGLQILWTTQCQDALSKAKSNKQVMVETNKTQLATLQDLSSWCLEDLGSKMNRIKIETLVTIQVHQRDVFADLTRRFRERKLSDANDFEWLKQTRFTWQANGQDEHGQGTCLITICDVEYKYNNEYLGCKERLVITPLTDRCFITLSQAMGMCLGGAPAGPAGTGKTETVKDLGRALGVFVVVTNCTDQQRFTDMARIFKGLCQAGLWGCFDEFNRIELPVLSVVAQQVLAITNAKRSHVPSFTFPGDSQEIYLNNHVGYFITMNPGYQGRQELPENLKALFRGVAMMVPDREIIIKVKLCSVGYQSFADLARKFAVLYGLCEQQLSKQKHYDFGLRNILSVLRSAGEIKRTRIQDPEEALLMSTLRDMNLSKLVAQDVPLFLSLISDLFPSLGMPKGQEHTDLKAALTNVVESEKLLMHGTWVTKVIQLYETTLVRHGIMMVGPSGSGKSRIINSLQDSLSQTTGILHKRIRMNPKAIRAEEMFGETDKMSGEWLDGIFAAMWAKFNDRNRKDIQWIVCDGPVDAIWIENLNTVLDDNKILTLANGDRVPMTDNVKLMFEVEDLRNASPATVSRAGIIFVSESDLDWEPVLKSWLMKKNPHQQNTFGACFKKYVGICEGPKAFGHLFNFINRNCKPVVQCSRVGMMEGCCHLLDGLLDIADLTTNSDALALELERLFLYSLSWAVGGLLETEDRIKFTGYVAQKAGPMAAQVFPKMEDVGDSIFDFRINTDAVDWERWAAPYWEYPASIEEPDFSSMLVPTVETTRASYILTRLHSRKRGALMTGSSGTAKTSTALMFFDSIQSETMRIKKLCFSSATSPAMLQAAIESELDKRGGKSFGPPGGKHMTVFMDDLSMPECNSWGDQPTLELVRQLVETSGCCFLDKDKRGDLKNVEDLQYIAAMGHPSGGRQDIPNRLKRHFFIFNMILPSSQAINEIYGQMMAGRFRGASIMIHAIVETLPNVSVELWNWMRKKMLPSPSKFHYTFTLRELSRVFQGLLRTPRSSIPDGKTLVQLWRHESERVYADKLTTLEDKKLFADQLDYFTKDLVHSVTIKATSMRNQPSSTKGADAVPAKFGAKQPKKPTPTPASVSTPAKPMEAEKLTVDMFGEDVYFVDFMRDEEYDDDGALVAEAPKLYELGGTLQVVRDRVQMFAGRHNEQFPSRPLNIILFDDALKHLLRISRCLGMPKGCILLVGVGGSGKQSLTKLASYCAGFSTFQITITKTYNMNSLLDDIRGLYKACGQRGEKITFLFTEAEIKDESFMEVVNAILTTGEIPNLIPKDELVIMASELRPLAIKSVPNFVESTDNFVKFFIDRVRSNLHVVLCMSPVSAKFAERARRFPGIVAGCTIDWFLAWPKEALIAVSEGYLSKLPLDCSESVKRELIVHMGLAHQVVVDSCEEYYAKMRRQVYQTPKSFLQFLTDYQAMYKMKCDEIVTKANRVEIGLEKLQSGAKDVEKMKVVLAEEEVKLKQSEMATNLMLSKLEVSSMEAKKEADAVAKIKESCQADAERIAGEKSDAEEDLAKAQPFLDEAERAVQSIKPNDLNELKKLGKPSDIIKIIFDCVSLLKMAPLIRVEPAEVTMGVGKDKKTFMFVKDSYKIVQGGMLADTRFLANIVQFSKVEKDFINDETVELMAPYLTLEGFNPFTARNASRAAEGLCTWCKAMIDYSDASKIVKPKLEALRLAEARLQDAERDLFKAEMRLKACQDILGALQQDFDKQLAAKRAIEENAKNTRKRMEQATSLISGLSGERVRWNSDREEFAHTKMQLIGDVALACAFVAYCGPFNQDFREYLIHHKLTADLRLRKIPFSMSMDLTDFLADVGTIGDWNLAGLPTDPLSIQNGILVTRSTRFALLIDPQGQALNWITNYEEHRLPHFGTSTFSNPRFREHVEYCMAEGKALIVAGVEQELDPMLTPLLEKQIVTKGKSKYLTMAGKVCDYNDSFMLYLVTRLPNPHFTPEEQSRCTIVDFTVTQKGLEEQLLGRVIQKEQRSLEESLKNVLEEVNGNTKALLRLDQMLLERLSENTGNLLDDEELISVLADTKSKSTDVKEKLLSAADMRKNINEKREQYRPVATRGSVLYFSIVDMSKVNCMYQTSLDQFQGLFDKSMDLAEKANLASKRVNNIIDSMTTVTYRYINRGLYEKDKTSFKLILTFKILTTASKLDHRQISLFLRAGSALDVNQAKNKPFAWMSNEAWLNILQLAQSAPVFKTIVDDIQSNESSFVPWYNENEPEKFPVPVIEGRFATEDEVLTNFYRLLVVRCMREDRTLLAVNDFIRKTEVIEINGNRLPTMGPKYVEPVTDTVDSVYREMDAMTPVIYLLSAGADPTDSIETLARRKRKDIECVSMGEGQDIVATRAIGAATANGSWVMLQNCHLGLEFIDSLEEMLLRMRAPESGCSPDFRLFITTEAHPKFSIGLLQMSTKVTNEPPKGLKAGLQRSYTVIVDQDRLERIESATWRTLLFALCFTHSVVQERRKFGPLGWSVPYEFNDGDLNATIMFLEKHLEFSTLSFSTLQYMTAEVQYGGRITDDVDRRLFAAYSEAWLSSQTLNGNFTFNPDRPINKIPDNFIYKIPTFIELDDFMAYILRFPDIDSPEILGLHPNADLTFRFKEVTQLLDTIVETQPKQSGGSGGGKTREDIVYSKCQELISSAPADFIEDEYEERINAMGSFSVPLNIFLYQEVQRLQGVINRVKGTLIIVMQAIRGEVVVTAEVMDAIDAVFDARVPKSWLYSTAGDELSWLTPGLGVWYGGLIQRDAQFRTWLASGRPASFWMAGFFNPQGFLTAVQQEITRAHKNESWALDSVALHAEVTDLLNADGLKNGPKEGVYVHGLFMDGAAWNSSESSIAESAPKKLFSPMPVLLVTAVTKAAKKTLLSSGNYGPFGPYDCPVYKYPARTDRYRIFSVPLATHQQKPLHWILRGVALLCSTS